MDFGINKLNIYMYMHIICIVYIYTDFLIHWNTFNHWYEKKKQNEKKKKPWKIPWTFPTSFAFAYHYSNLNVIENTD